LALPGVAAIPESINRIAFPAGDSGINGAAATSVRIGAATPPPDGMLLLGVRADRLQVCSAGAKVKSSLPF
jgi:hypothetical protein